MDLRKFYLENVSQDEYYYNFYDLVADVNKTYNVFGGEQETEDYSFDVYDIEEAIDNFKTSCQPENDGPSKEYDAWFYLSLFYLYKCGFVINEFPRLVEHPPKERYDFTYKAIRNKIIDLGQDQNGTVKYATRRVFISHLTFTQKDHTISISATIDAKFKEISNRQASFQSMSTDEKLAEIANLIENMLKKDGNFLTLDYSSICFNFLDDKTIREYRKSIQCFRHSAPESIAERATFTNEQKGFMIDYGLTIIKTIHTLVEE